MKQEHCDGESRMARGSRTHRRDSTYNYRSHISEKEEKLKWYYVTPTKQSHILTGEEEKDRIERVIHTRFSMEKTNAYSHTPDLKYNREGTPFVPLSLEMVKPTHQKELRELSSDIEAYNVRTMKQKKSQSQAYIDISNQSVSLGDAPKIPDEWITYTIDPLPYENKFPDVAEFLAVNQELHKDLLEQPWWIEFAQQGKERNRIMSLLDAFLFVKRFPKNYPNLFDTILQGSQWSSFDTTRSEDLLRQKKFLQGCLYLFYGNPTKLSTEAWLWQNMNDLLSLPFESERWKSLLKVAKSTGIHAPEVELDFDAWNRPIFRNAFQNPE